ncbi:MAG: lipoate protein ligase C-terminal domain-containing protein, partial [Candidatus Methanomethylicaceae archaeon]
MKIGIKKVEGGKLIKVKLLEEKGIIKDIKITGDFFAHPEEAIEELENILKNTPLIKVKENIKKFIEEKNI